MTILGALPQAIGRGQNLYDYGNASGPTSYLIGTGVGFTTLLGTPLDWEVWVDDQTLLRASDTGYALVSTLSSGVTKTLVYSFAAGAWAESANAGNFAGIKFRYRAVGT